MNFVGADMKNTYVTTPQVWAPVLRVADDDSDENTKTSMWCDRDKCKDNSERFAGFSWIRKNIVTSL